jgi:hypothetical protein
MLPEKAAQMVRALQNCLWLEFSDMIADVYVEREIGTILTLFRKAGSGMGRRSSRIF